MNVADYEDATKTAIDVYLLLLARAASTPVIVGRSLVISAICWNNLDVQQSKAVDQLP